MTEYTDSDHAERGNARVMKNGRCWRARWVPFIVLFGAFIAAVPGAGHAGIAEDLGRVYDRGDYQREIPSGLGATPQTPPGDQSDETPRNDPAAPDTAEDAGGSQTGTFSANPAIELLLWVLLGVGALLLGVHLFKTISRMRWPFAGAETDEPSQSAERTGSSEGPVVRPLSEIERLAAEGAFGDAVHMLLLHCFGELRRRFPHAREPALTSREVLSRASLAPKAQSGLATIVSAVEAGHFGGKAIDRTMYQNCLDGYRDIASSDAT